MRPECEFHATFEIDGSAFCVTLELLVLLLLLLVLLVLFVDRPRTNSLTGGHVGRGPGSGV